MPKNAVAVLVDNDVAEQKVAVCIYDPQNYRSKVFWLLIFHVNEVEKQLRAV